MKDQDIIRLDNLSKTYQIESQKVEALRDISLTIPRGSTIAVTGRSGSGKSTMLHIVGTLDRPSTGEIYLMGSNINKLNDAKVSQFRNQTIGFVFQMNNLLPEFSALENVMMPGLIARANRDKVMERASDLLRSVGLEQRMAHRPGELSGGEQQRVAIARALLMEPPILLADEPTGNLDKKSSQAVQELLLQLCDQRGITMLLITHDMELAKRLPQQIILEDGKILDFGGSW